MNTYHHENLKRELLKTGILLITEKGIDNFSLRELARKCNVSEVAPYRHFKNKEDLVNNIKAYIENEFILRLKNVRDSKDVLLNMGLVYLSFFKENVTYFQFLFNNLDLHFDLTFSKTNYQPLAFFANKAKEVLKDHYSKVELNNVIIKMWSLIHGLTYLSLCDKTDSVLNKEKVEEILRSELI